MNGNLVIDSVHEAGGYTQAMDTLWMAGVLEMELRVEFCGEIYRPDVAGDFYIGRTGDLVVDDNPLLHAKLLKLCFAGEFWWIQNVGQRLAAMLATPDGLLNAWLGPGAQLPMVNRELLVRFIAGATTYELNFYLDRLPELWTGCEGGDDGSGEFNGIEFSDEQRLLLLALVEPVINDRFKGVSSSLSSAELARRLGWSIAKLNRKLDTVCEKFESMGVRGLHGAPDRLAANRKVRLIEHLLATQYFVPADLEELHRYVEATRSRICQRLDA